MTDEERQLVGRVLYWVSIIDWPSLGMDEEGGGFTQDETETMGRLAAEEFGWSEREDIDLMLRRMETDN